MENEKRRAEDAERLPAEKLEWEAPAVDAAELDDLGKLKALAEAAKGQRSALYMAAIDCGHSITEGRIILHLDARREGNALSQLADRLEEAAAPLAALVAQHETDLDAYERLCQTKDAVVVQQAARIAELERLNTELHDLVYADHGIAFSVDNNEVFIDGFGLLPIGTIQRIADLEEDLSDARNQLEAAAQEVRDADAAATELEKKLAPQEGK